MRRQIAAKRTRRGLAENRRRRARQNRCRGAWATIRFREGAGYAVEALFETGAAAAATAELESQLALDDSHYIARQFSVVFSVPVDGPALRGVDQYAVLHDAGTPSAPRGAIARGQRVSLHADADAARAAAGRPGSTFVGGPVRLQKARPHAT